MIKRYNQFVKSNKPIKEEFLNVPEIEDDVLDVTNDVESDESYEEEGEEGGYIGQRMMNELADKLGAKIESDGSIVYGGKVVNFYSETEMFHIDRKKFKTVDEVIKYLDTQVEKGGSEPEGLEETDIKGVVPPTPDEDGMDKFESKSYKFTRKFNKRK